MSWSWDNDSKEEKKEYDYKGTVTISTEEYKDLVSKVYELKIAGQKEHDDWYKEYSRANELEKKNKDLSSKLDVFNTWLEGSEEIRAKFKLWKLEQMVNKEDE